MYNELLKESKGAISTVDWGGYQRNIKSAISKAIARAQHYRATSGDNNSHSHLLVVNLVEHVMGVPPTKAYDDKLTLSLVEHLESQGFTLVHNNETRRMAIDLEIFLY